MLVNNATQTQTFTVAVINVGGNLTVESNKKYNYTINDGSATHSAIETVNITKIGFPRSAKMHGEYTLQPGEQQLINVSGVAPDEAIVVLVYDEEEKAYRAIKSLSCGGAILGYRVTSQAGGPDDWTTSTHSCSNW